MERLMRAGLLMAEVPRNKSGYTVDGVYRFHKLLMLTIERAIKNGEVGSAGEWVKKIGWKDSTYRPYADKWEGAKDQSIENLYQKPTLLKDPSPATVDWLGRKGVIKDENGNHLNKAALIKILESAEGELIIPGDHQGSTTAKSSLYARAIALIYEALNKKGLDSQDVLESMPFIEEVLGGRRATFGECLKVAELDPTPGFFDELEKIYEWKQEFPANEPSGNGKNLKQTNQSA